MVEHVMDAIHALCDRCVVMNAGRIIAEGTPRLALAEPEVVRAYLGEPDAWSHPLRLLGEHRALSDVSLTLDRGEIAVVLGANGAGKTTLLKAIAGLLKPPSARR